ncbi:hypothetical protein FRB98_001458 [Tulasnella sp. 332]|nr:hypothetical protein FRB98_001458 [Tulasnella sp. 332]
MNLKSPRDSGGDALAADLQEKRAIASRSFPWCDKIDSNDPTASIQGPSHNEAMSQVQETITRLRGASLALVNETANHLPHLKLQRRTASPIHALPAELIIKIVKLATYFTAHRDFTDDDDDDDDPHFSNAYYEKLHVLAQVCRVLAEIVKGTPELWSVVSFKDKESNWRASLRLSQSHPLTIRYEHYWRDTPFWSAVIPVIQRWRVACITLMASEALRLASDLEMVGAPELEGLRIQYRESRGESLPALDILRGWAPNLRDLSLTTIILRDWSSPIMHRLHSLSLLSIYSILSLETFSNALQGCLNLKMLRLHYVGFDSVAGDRATLNLPHLRALYLEYLNDDVDEYLLSRLRAPFVNDVRILKDPVGDVPTKSLYVSTVTSFLANPFDTCMVSAGNIRMEGGDAIIRIAMEAERSTNKVGSFNIDHIFYGAQILDWITQRLDTSIPIIIAFIPCERMASVIAALSPLTGVVKFAITVWEQYLDILLDALSSPRTHFGGKNAWLWPELEFISIDSRVEEPVAESVLRMLQRRYGAVAMSKGTLKSIRRAPGESAFVCSQALHLESDDVESDDAESDDGENQMTDDTPIEYQGEEPLESTAIECFGRNVVLEYQS